MSHGQPGSYENGVATSDSPFLIRQQDVQGQLSQVGRSRFASPCEKTISPRPHHQAVFHCDHAPHDRLGVWDQRTSLVCSAATHLRKFTGAYLALSLVVLFPLDSSRVSARRPPSLGHIAATPEPELFWLMLAVPIKKVPDRMVTVVVVLPFVAYLHVDHDLSQCHKLCVRDSVT